MENKEYFQNQFKQKSSSVAVLLVNFGGPQDLNAVKPFLYELFSDPAVLNFPLAFLYRKPLAWLISYFREKISCEMYKKIDGKSPLMEITNLQAEKLQELFNINELRVDVFCAFRYCNPFICNVLDEIRKRGYKKIVVLPLFPQYSYTTTGSIQLVIKKWLESKNIDSIEICFIKEWYKDEDFILAHTHLIKKALKNLDLRSTEIIFTAHSIPLFNIENKDPYKEQITKTCENIIKNLNWKKRWHLSYQSKIGPVKWLEPGTDKVIEEIAQRNKRANLLLVPLSFVCDHVETLYEIDILYKETANKCGIKKFLRTEALNTNKYLIQALYNQLVGSLEITKVDIKEILRIQ